ncbi:L-aspartate oxidase [Candidatus Halobonum tyrrellensis]|uniref:L-aspartate oxidase n=1 Tax=Candidatus Halobonum tyrrellensis G22 TaxID=1324957 RepID=V4GRZ6_9EURY|nr:FAD-dependent oxidoreductase [Candidatus Halobonum tyrrellensis]ESP87821.1 l-aspartate oxidase [Candidatus Halobonum tyrrellensis G22]
MSRDHGREAYEADVLVVGSGIAGCATALAAAREGADVLVATKAEEPTDASTDWAQGGIAVTQSDPEAFAADIRAAGAGECDPDAVETLVGDARGAVEDALIDTLGVEFDRREGDAADATDADGAAFDLGREAAHSERRILHVDASTGRHVLRPFLAHLRGRENVRILEDTAAYDLITHEGRVHGALVEPPADERGTDGDADERSETDGDETDERDGDDGGRDAEGRSAVPAFAGATVLATGGVGGLYRESTNPDGATGDGVAMAALAGADVAGMQYVQFHPTAYAGDDPFLVSEAVRGEGAVLRNADGERFMPAVHDDAELAPRDVVARAVARERDRTDDVRLDVSPVDFREQFPGLAADCDERGVDPADGIPVAPAEHFLCGGVDVDLRGRASLDRLFAVGECSHTGVHGANRLASTSLLEGLVWGLRAGETAAGVGVDAGPERVEAPDPRDGDPALPDSFARGKFRRLRDTASDALGIERRPEEVGRAAATLRRLKGEVDAYTRTRTSRGLYELRNATVVGLLIARAAANADSAGCHRLVREGGADSDGAAAGEGGEAGAD